MKRITLAIVFVGYFLGNVMGQQYPFFTQGISDPYVINPSFVAHTGQGEVNALYRQQWSQIEDGPHTFLFNMQHPVNEKVALGINLMDDRTVLLSRTTAMATFGYKLSLARNHVLGFGLSGGVISNRIRLEDLSAADAQDPVLLRSLENNFGFDGQFGVHYAHKTFLLGFSLTKLVDNRTFVEGSTFQEITFGQLRNRIAFLTNVFSLSENVGFQPYLMYRFSDHSDLNFFESTAMLLIKNRLEIGGGFRENFGPIVLAKINWKSLQVGYSFDFPSNHAQVSTGGTNEIHIKWRMRKVVRNLANIKPAQNIIADAVEKFEGNNQSEKPGTQKVGTPKPGFVPVTSFIQTPQENDEALKSTAETAPGPQTVAKVPPSEQVTKKTPVISQKETDIEKKQSAEAVPSTQSIDKKWYLIIGTFENKLNASRFIKNLEKENLAGEIKYSTENDYFYVHLPEYATDEITLDKVLELRMDTRFKDAWFKEL